MKKKIEIDEFEDIDMEVDHSKSIRENLDLVKCTRCNTMNVKGAKVCVKCKKDLNNKTKTCPKCAKYNDINSKRCVSCGYKFGKKHVLLKSFILSLIVVLILFIATYIKGETLRYDIGVRIICWAVIVSIILSTLNHNSKDQVDLNADEKTQKSFRRMEFLGKLFIFLGFMIAFFALYWFFIR
ncbi:MAG: zinc ribbon domain-containing protein [Bacilli bacterium]|nr:zinc ribbon domain-containing protein [Bacilli bacterium]